MGPYWLGGRHQVIFDEWVEVQIHWTNGIFTVHECLICMVNECKYHDSIGSMGRTVSSHSCTIQINPSCKANISFLPWILWGIIRLTKRLSHSSMNSRLKFTSLMRRNFQCTETTTLLKTKIAPENGWLGDFFYLGAWPIFRGYASFREGRPQIQSAGILNDNPSLLWIITIFECAVCSILRTKCWGSFQSSSIIFCQHHVFFWEAMVRATISILSSGALCHQALTPRKKNCSLSSREVRSESLFKCSSVDVTWCFHLQGISHAGCGSSVALPLFPRSSSFHKNHNRAEGFDNFIHHRVTQMLHVWIICLH